MDTEYLTQEQLTGFENYKYSSIDSSPFSTYIMHPFWNKVVEFVPKWVAPNVLTFSGFVITIAIFLMFSGMDYKFQSADPNHPDVASLPNWAFMVAAIGIFVAYTLDGIDGKQARRTGSSSPIGELFDHGIDSYSTPLISIAMYSVFSSGEKYSINTFRMYYVIWNVQVNFHLSHWEKYNTGVLYLPWGYDLTMWGTVLTNFVAGVWGQEVWQFVLPGGITAGKVFEIIVYAHALFLNIPIISWNVYVSYRDRTGHMRSFREAVRPLASVVICFILFSVWVFRSPSNILDRDPRLVFFLTGTIFSNICCRLIVAQMSSTRCELINWLLIPTAGVVLLSLLTNSAEVEIALTYTLCLFATLAHIHYATCVVRQMCRHFNIKCFSLQHQKD